MNVEALQIMVDADSPRSVLLKAFIIRLNETGTPYAVMNNYEDLPHVIPSDIDITVPSEFFSRLDRFILDFANSAEAPLVQKLWHGNQKCAYILGSGTQGTQEFLQLDFFVAFSTKAAPALLSHTELIAGAHNFKNFKVPKPEVELLFTVLRRLFKDDWSTGHCARIAELNSRITIQGWLPKSYKWLETTINHAILGDVDSVSVRRAEDWRRLRNTARSRVGLYGLVANALVQSWRILYRLRDETGMVVVIDGSADPFDANARNRLEMVFHRHFWIDNKQLENLGVLARLRIPFNTALLKRRKGLVILNVEDGNRKTRSLARWLVWTGQVDQTLKAQGTTPALAVESIVRAQSEKTRRSLRRGGTQTSGQ